MSLREWRCLECRAVLGHRCGRVLKLTLDAIMDEDIRERDILIWCKCGTSKVWDMREAVRV